MDSASARASRLFVSPEPTSNKEPVRSGRTIRLDNVSLTFGPRNGGLKALSEINLDIHEGEFVALVGPSGCGKSTILKLVSGLLVPTTGRLTVDDQPLVRGKLGIGIAFQNPTMLPWLTIEHNVMLPLKIVEPFRSEFRKKRRNEYRGRVRELLAQVGLEGFAEKFPWQLSGGMLQRASLCRALIHGPQLLLLDEPFGALDQFTREELWSIMQDLWMKRRPTVLLVTHDLREAAYLAGRICVMSSRPGRILADEPVEFSRPRTIPLTYQQNFVALNLRLRSLIVK